MYRTGSPEHYRENITERRINLMWRQRQPGSICVQLGSHLGHDRAQLLRHRQEFIRAAVELGDLFDGHASALGLRARSMARISVGHEVLKPILSFLVWTRAERRSGQHGNVGMNVLIEAYRAHSGFVAADVGQQCRKVCAQLRKGPGRHRGRRQGTGGQGTRCLKNSRRSASRCKHRNPPTTRVAATMNSAVSRGVIPCPRRRTWLGCSGSAPVK